MPAWNACIHATVTGSTQDTRLGWKKPPLLLLATLPHIVDFHFHPASLGTGNAKKEIGAVAVT